VFFAFRSLPGQRYRCAWTSIVNVRKGEKQWYDGYIDSDERELHTMTKNRGRTTALGDEQQEKLLSILEARFEQNMNRHQGIEWGRVLTQLKSNPDKLWSLNEMERTGGEPDVVGQDQKTREFIFYDCSAESPAGRRSLCYDDEALQSRKENKPANSALGMAAAMGIELLTEAQYRALQKLGEFDTKTSSWVATPADIRELGGAIFCDRRYNTVFVYHNGAESYYGARGFRGSLKV